MASPGDDTLVRVCWALDSDVVTSVWVCQAELESSQLVRGGLVVECPVCGGCIPRTNLHHVDRCLDRSARGVQPPPAPSPLSLIPPTVIRLGALMELHRLLPEGVTTSLSSAADGGPWVVMPTPPTRGRPAGRRSGVAAGGACGGDGNGDSGVVATVRDEDRARMLGADLVVVAESKARAYCASTAGPTQLDVEVLLAAGRGELVPAWSVGASVSRGGSGKVDAASARTVDGVAKLFLPPMTTGVASGMAACSEERDVDAGKGRAFVFGPPPWRLSAPAQAAWRAACDSCRCDAGASGGDMAHSDACNGVAYAMFQSCVAEAAERVATPTATSVAWSRRARSGEIGAGGVGAAYRDVAAAAASQRVRQERDAAVCTLAWHNGAWLRVDASTGVATWAATPATAMTQCDLHGMHAIPAVAFLQQVYLPSVGRVAGAGRVNIILGAGRHSGGGGAGKGKATMRSAVLAWVRSGGLSALGWRLVEVGAANVVLARV